jgi:predicted glutamine amidotransferase
MLIMCRLLGVVADSPAPLGELLAEDLDPFLQLACEHEDGWGIALRTPEGGIRILKGTDRADTDAVLRRHLEEVVTDEAFVHLRMASPNLAVTMANTHPFGDEKTAFGHNGDFFPINVLDGLHPFERPPAPGGDTDSERYYLTVRHRLDEGVPPEVALRRTAADIRHRADRFASLNCMLLTPDGLYAYSEHHPDSDVVRRRGPDYFGLSYREASGRTLVASQGWPQPAPSWQAIAERHVLRIGLGDRALTVSGA